MPYLVRLWDRHRHVAWSSRYAEAWQSRWAWCLTRALISDINPHTINFYRWLKSGLSIRLRCRTIRPISTNNERRFNQLIRDGKADSKEAASLFYYLNRTCYNGLCRFNSKGEFNVPFGRYKKLIYKTDFTEYVPAFAQWDFTCVDFEKVPLEAERFHLCGSAV